jgi:predicted nucleic acid-binding protein
LTEKKRMRGDDVFFDTNVLLYLISGDITKADRAEALLAVGGVISVQVLNEFAAVALRKQAVDFMELREILATIRAVCAVKPVDIETHELGLNLTERHRFSIYDGLIIAAALRAGCSLLYTEDLADGQTIEQLTVRNPFALK